MDELHIKPTKKTLQIDCTPGSITLEGNSILSDPEKHFQPVRDWITHYVKNPNPVTQVHLRFEYIDTASVHSVLNLLKILKEIPDTENRVNINWFYDFDDPELLEVGEIIEGRLGIKFNYAENQS